MYDLNSERRLYPRYLVAYAQAQELDLFTFRNATLPPSHARVKAYSIITSEMNLLRGPFGNSHLDISDPLKRGKSIKRLGLLGIICREANSGNWPAVKAFFQKEADRFDPNMLAETSTNSSQEISEEDKKIAQSYRNLACSLGV